MRDEPESPTSRSQPQATLRKLLEIIEEHAPFDDTFAADLEDIRSWQRLGEKHVIHKQA